MNKVKTVLAFSTVLILGIVIGGYLFSQSQPRSFLSISNCRHCLRGNDLAGLLVSSGIQKFPHLIPSIILETVKTIAIKIPDKHARYHYVILPKKDIKNIGELTDADAPYLTDAFFVIRKIIEDKKFSKYYLFTNGPDFQKVTYLHFHLIAE
jgi:histidine triad (HIT) family protein